MKRVRLKSDCEFSKKTVKEYTFTRDWLEVPDETYVFRDMEVEEKIPQSIPKPLVESDAEIKLEPKPEPVLVPKPEPKPIILLTSKKKKRKK